MGTRANFFLGKPEADGVFEWLGCVAWDGHLEGNCGEALAPATSGEDFVARVAAIKEKRDDFTDPATHSFPFPWPHDVFISDCTYAFFDGETHGTYFHAGWVPMKRYLSDETFREEYGNSEKPDELAPVALPKQRADLPPGTDSIMILGLAK